MKSKTKRVLVIGSEGFIGSHIMKDPHGYDLVRFDLKLHQDAREEIDGDYYRAIFLACDFGNTKGSFDNNHKMADQVEKAFGRRVIYTSSAAVYPDQFKSMKERDAQPDKNNWYGLSKFQEERSRFNTIFRLSNVYGEGGRGVSESLADNNFTVHGDGCQVRDFIPVDEVVTAIFKALDAPERYKGIFNLSSGVGTTIRDRALEYGAKKINYTKDDPGYRFSVLDNTKFKATQRVSG